MGAGKADSVDLDPLDPATVECPYAFYSALREHGVFRVPGRGFFLVGGYDLCMQVLKDTDTFSSKAGPGVPQGPNGAHLIDGQAVHTLLTADPPQQRKYRDLVNKAFSIRRISSWEPVIRVIADDLVDQFIERGECELLYDFAVPLPLIVICDSLGLPRSRLRTFKAWSDGIARLGGMVTGDEMKRIVAESAEFSAYLRDMIVDRQRNLGDDFISDLIRSRYDGERPLDLPELMSIVSQFLVAGNETTTNTIASGMALLCEHPDQLAELRGDPSLIPNFVEEVLRFESPVQAHFRVAIRDTELDGVKIPQGAGVGVVYGCANRDGRRFERPEVFDIHRENASRHLAFSHGIHFCPGAPLARMESTIAFEHLLTRLQDIRLVADRSDLTHVPSFTHRGLRKLTIAFSSG